MTLCGSVTLTLCLSFSGVIFFSSRMIKKLSTHVSQFSQTKILSKQLNKTLMIQAFSPLVIGNIPMIFLIFSCIFNVGNSTIPLYLSFFLGWVSIVNPIAAITIITPYRQRIKQIIWRQDTTISTQQLPSVIPTNLVTALNDTTATNVIHTASLLSVQ